MIGGEEVGEDEFGGGVVGGTEGEEPGLDGGLDEMAGLALPAAVLLDDGDGLAGGTGGRIERNGTAVVAGDAEILPDEESGPEEGGRGVISGQ